MSNQTDLQALNEEYESLIAMLATKALAAGDMKKSVYDADNDGIVDNAAHAATADTALVADGLSSTVLSASSSITPTSKAATDVHSLTLSAGVWIYIISVTWSKINTATKVMVRNSQRKVPSKCYGYFPVSNITPGIQSVDIITLTADTTVYSQIWPEDDTSLKAYSVQTHAIKIA